MPRKTVEITAIIDEVNRRNRGSTCAAELRMGWNSLLEGILKDANVYAGFGYLVADQLEGDAIGQNPGMAYDNGTTFPDESRVYYYCHEKLRNRG